MPRGDPGLARLTTWFRDYAASFCACDPEAAPIYRMKAAHTGRVRRGIRRLAAAEGLSGRALVLAEMAGLLHDAGRFEQYRRYRTFRDAQSVHHGRLAVSLIRTHGLLNDLQGIERHRVLSAVAHHNEMRLRPLADPDALFLLKLLRDADKLDILKMAAARTNGRRRTGPLTDLNVPADGPCSPAVAAAVKAGGVVALANVRSRCDALLFFLSWVFDFNFPAAFRQVLGDGSFDRLADAVPHGAPACEAVRNARNHAETRAAQPPAGRTPV
jgi:hypothetical protein